MGLQMPPTSSAGPPTRPHSRGGGRPELSCRSTGVLDPHSECAGRAGEDTTIRAAARSRARAERTHGFAAGFTPGFKFNTGCAAPPGHCRLALLGALCRGLLGAAMRGVPSALDCSGYSSI